MGMEAGDVVRDVDGKEAGGRLRQRGRVKEAGWGLLKVAFRIAFGLSRGSGHTRSVRAGARLLFVDGCRL